MKKSVIKDHRSGKLYWDDGIIRNFESVLHESITWENAKKKYPSIINPS